VPGSSSAFVLVDNAPEDIMAADGPTVGRWRARLGHGEVKAS
jgi:hypothetical protein